MIKQQMNSFNCKGVANYLFQSPSPMQSDLKCVSFLSLDWQNTPSTNLYMRNSQHNPQGESSEGCTLKKQQGVSTVFYFISFFCFISYYFNFFHQAVKLRYFGYIWSVQHKIPLLQKKKKITDC